MESNIQAQLERFRKGFPWLKIEAPATPSRGIRILSAKEQDEMSEYASKADVRGRCKFVPASGAASRMFKDIFAGMEKANGATEKLAANIERFAFYDAGVFGKAPYSPESTAAALLSDDGLGYGSKPKGVLKFHRYADECRTAFAEHLVEGQKYMRNADGSVNMTVTISPEHRGLFEAALAEVKDKYEARYGVRYNIRFTFQDKATDTVAADGRGNAFVTDEGKILFRPAGHGALIHNLNAVEEELVSIKNIDNVCAERMLDTTARWKTILAGCALAMRDRLFGYLRRLDEEGHNPALLDEVEKFLSDELCIDIPSGLPDCERAALLRRKLNRPVRVCGMVRNEGEPGGGPFIIKGGDGCTSLQILESVQINPDDPDARAALAAATHFNPVDIICCKNDYKGGSFDLTTLVDPETGFISSKSYQGRELKALELPGLWNGSMSDWNTVFVEVPAETFNPVKVVLDLLRPAHQQ